MKPTADSVTRAVTHEACEVLAQSLIKIKHCLAQLNEDQVWWRPKEDMNSIGNLILHLTGNVRQWIVVGLGDQTNTRNRQAEFSERGPIKKSVLLHELEAVVEAAKGTLRRTTAEQMLSARRIQGFDTTGWGALFDSVPHFKGHTQELTCLTRMQLGSAYQFHWQPQTAEQGGTK
jgi:hypothetical protein